jgi:hypothetical protein
MMDLVETVTPRMTQYINEDVNETRDIDTKQFTT